MIGGLFIYNHKGEVLISRVYRDDIGYVRDSAKQLNVIYCISRVLQTALQCVVAVVSNHMGVIVIVTK